METTVDRSSKNNRIMKWIKQGAERSQTHGPPDDDIEEEEVAAIMNTEDSVAEELEDIEIDRITPD